MSKFWQYEKATILLTLSAIIAIGVVYHDWVVAVTLPLTLTLGWLYFRLYRLEQWIDHGSKLSEVTDDVGLIGLMVRQIYRQKKVHNKRKKRTKTLLRRLNTNIAALPDATVLLNEQFEIEWFNEAARYLLKLKSGDYGQRITNLLRQPEFQQYLLDPSSQNGLETPSPNNQHETLQIKIVSFGDNQRLIIARNISEQKQMQQALKGFIANASHELQTPLTSIIGYVEILEMESGLSDTGKKSVAVIEQQSKRMQHLIRDLLQLSRIESSTLEPDEGEVIDIGDFMQNLMSALSIGCNQGQIQCQVDPSLKLRGNASDVMSICRNLLENALKHCDDKTAIRVSWQSLQNNELEYCVEDDGEGVDEKEIPQLTQRYYRGDSTTAGGISGSGLGLAIVEQAAHRHGAKLTIRSKRHEGSRFCVTFPSLRNVTSKPSRNQGQSQKPL
jgi:two-component system phosphate regulon sensor histidine kinase PhoR